MELLHADPLSLCRQTCVPARKRSISLPTKHEHLCRMACLGCLPTWLIAIAGRVLWCSVKDAAQTVFLTVVGPLPLT